MGLHDRLFPRGIEASPKVVHLSPRVGGSMPSGASMRGDVRISCCGVRISARLCVRTSRRKGRPVSDLAKCAAGCEQLYEVLASRKSRVFAPAVQIVPGRPAQAGRVSIRKLVGVFPPSVFALTPTFLWAEITRPTLTIR